MFTTRTHGGVQEEDCHSGMYNQVNAVFMHNILNQTHWSINWGGGGGWHVASGVLFSSAAGSAYWPIAIRCPSLGPFPSVGGGAHRPPTALCLSFSSLRYLALSVGGGGGALEKGGRRWR